MNIADLKRIQSQRELLLRKALNEAVAALDSLDSEGEHVTAKEAHEGHVMHSTNACIHLRQAAVAARRARVGEGSTT